MPYIENSHFVIRIVGGAVTNTTAGYAAEQKDGIGLSKSGRLCNFMSDKLMEFSTKDDAERFIETWKHKDQYVCEVLWRKVTKWVKATDSK